MRKRGWSLAELARVLETDGPQVTRVCYGDRLPGRKLAMLLSKRAHVAQDLWDEPCPTGWLPHGVKSPDAPASSATNLTDTEAKQAG